MFELTGFPFPVSVQSPTPALQPVTDVKEMQLTVESLAGTGVSVLDTGKSHFQVQNFMCYQNRNYMYLTLVIMNNFRYHAHI